MKFTAVCMTTNLNDFNGPHQPTNLGVSGSNPFGRASLRDIPCESHGIHTAPYLETGNMRGRFRTGRTTNLGVRNSNLLGRAISC